MIFLPDTNACITLLRRRDDRLIARWKSVKATDIALCSIVVYELRYGAQRSLDPAREQAKLDLFFSLSLHCLSTISAHATALKFAPNWNEQAE